MAADDLGPNRRKYTINKSGPKIEPWGTTKRRGEWEGEASPSEENQSRATPLTLARSFNRPNSTLWSTASNAYWGSEELKWSAYQHQLKAEDHLKL